MTTHSEASRHKATILTYWRQRGKDPTVWVEQARIKVPGQVPNSVSTEIQYCVRSDMRNGKPRD